MSRKKCRPVQNKIWAIDFSISTYHKNMSVIINIDFLVQRIHEY
jgi:hypothetical protein